MKKRLRPILIAVPLLIAALIIGIFLFRHRTSGEILLNQVLTASTDTYLLQVREVGARQIKLADGTASRITYSPNGRYLAATEKEDGKNVCRVYDLASPKKPLYEVAAASCTGHWVTDDGRLVLLMRDQSLCLGSASGSETLAQNVSRLGELDGELFYYFTEPEEGHYTLWVLDLNARTADCLLENTEPSSLQLCRDEQGRPIAVATQRATLTGTAYDQVIDTDPTDENPLREKLQARTVSQDVRHLYRWVDGARELLAENMVHDYFCSPVHGLVVHRVATLALPVEKLEDLRYDSLTEPQTRYCSRGGQRFILEGLNEASITFSSEGDIYAFSGSRLSHYRWDGSGFRSQVLMEKLDAFCLVYNPRGEAVLYTLSGGELCRTTDRGTEVLAQDVTQVWLPCTQNSDGTKLHLQELIYLTRYYDEKTDSVSATYIKWPQRNPPDSYVYLLQNGQEQTLLLAKRSALLLQYALPNGSVMAVHNESPVGLPSSERSGWVLGPNRVERILASISGTVLGDTCLVHLQ